MPTKHALLAPSAAARWMACPPSARLESEIPGKDTIFTQEGTLAHSVAEYLLTYYRGSGLVGVVDDILQTTHTWCASEWKELVARAEELGVDWAEMLTTVHDGYVRLVYDDYLRLRTADPDAVLIVEAELALDYFIPEGFGSSDAVIIAGDILQVYDLKYGKGVKVSALGNPQMMCYALGAVYGPGETYDINHVFMTIIQPRLRHTDTYEMPLAGLVSWGLNVLKPAAELAFSGKGSKQPGEHCKFCRAAARCEALKDFATGTRLSAEDPALMTPEEFAEVYAKLDIIKNWIARCEEYALNELSEGRSIPGYKLVEGRSLRKVSDPDAVIGVLEKAGFTEADYMKRELKGISDLERLVGKKQFGKLLGEYVVKPQGKPTVAPEDDPRPAFSATDDDFKDIRS